MECGLSVAVPLLYEGVEFFGRHLVLGLFTCVGCHWRALIVFFSLSFIPFLHTPVTFTSPFCDFFLCSLRCEVFCFTMALMLTDMLLISPLLFVSDFLTTLSVVSSLSLYSLSFVLGGVYSIRVCYLSYPKGIFYTTDLSPSPSTLPFRSNMCITYLQKPREGAVFSCLYCCFSIFWREARNGPRPGAGFLTQQR